MRENVASRVHGPPWTRPRGFVLAEVITVAVIVGILAAVAIPIYTSYVKNQRKSVVKSIAQSGAASANIYYRRTAVVPPDSASLKLFLSDPKRFTVVVHDSFIVVKDVSSSDLLTDSARFR